MCMPTGERFYDLCSGSCSSLQWRRFQCDRGRPGREMAADAGRVSNMWIRWQDDLVAMFGSCEQSVKPSTLNGCGLAVAHMIMQSSWNQTTTITIKSDRMKRQDIKQFFAIVCENKFLYKYYVLYFTTYQHRLGHIYHIEVETNWPLVCRRHYQMRFLKYNIF